MASSRANFPTLGGCKGKSARSVSGLAHRIIEVGLYVNPIEFPTPVPAKADFVIAVGLLDTYSSKARGNHDFKVLRDEQCKIVFAILKGLLEYVKPICGSDPDLISKSGFPCSRTPQKASVPPRPVVNRVVKGKIAGTYKVYLEKIVNKPDVPVDPSTHLKNVTYAVDLTLTPDVETSWITVRAGVSFNNIIFGKYTLNVKNYGRVWAINASGESQPSMIFSFIPE